MEAGLGARTGPRRAAKAQAVGPTRSTPAGRAAPGKPVSAEERENVQLRIFRDGEELKHEGGEKRPGARRGLGSSEAELKAPDAWLLGPSSRPPISRHRRGQSLRAPLSSPTGSHLGSQMGSKEREGPTMVTSSRPGGLCTPRRAASPTAARRLPQRIQAEHTWGREQPGRTRPEGAG